MTGGERGHSGAGTGDAASEDGGLGIDGAGRAAGRLDVVVPASLDGMRVDRVVALVADLPRSTVGELVASGMVHVDGVPVTVRSRPVVAGQALAIDVPASGGDERPEPDGSVAFLVVHADDAVIVVDKPAGLVVHPGHGNPTGTLVNGLLARFPDLADWEPPAYRGRVPADALLRPGIVHRLDRDTSGLLVVARTAEAYRSLASQLADRRMERRYVALVQGAPDSDRGIVDAPIGRSATSPTRMAVAAGGRPARTHYEVVRRFGDGSGPTLVHLALETGRTHQIRVHLAAIGHPVVGDPVYGRGGDPPGTPRLCLHAASLAFDHPRSGDRVRWESPLPADLASFVRRIEGGSGDSGAGGGGGPGPGAGPG